MKHTLQPESMQFKHGEYYEWGSFETPYSRILAH